MSVFLPDDLAEEVRRAGLSVEAVTQQAVRRELALRATAWVQRVEAAGRGSTTHARVLAALDEVRGEAGQD